MDVQKYETYFQNKQDYGWKIVEICTLYTNFEKIKKL